MADLSKIKLNGVEYDLKDNVARETIENLPEDKLYLINVTMTSINSGISDKSSTEIKAAVDAGKLPIVKTSMDNMSMMATLVNIEEMLEEEETHYIATFMYNDENPEHTISSTFLTKAVMIITGTNVHVNVKTGSYITNRELAAVATSGSYNDLSDMPTIPNVPAWALESSKPIYTAAEVGALPDSTTYVSSVNEQTGVVIVDKIKTTAGAETTDYNLIGTASSNVNTLAISVYNPGLLSFAKYTNNYARLTIGDANTPGVVRIYTNASSGSGFTDIKSNASSTNERTVNLPDASGTVALTSDIPSVSSWALAANKPNYTFAELTAHPNSLGGYGITDAYTKIEVDGLVSGVLHYKGTKATISALPSSGNVIGDVWHITADGSEWAWDGSDWQELGTAVDLSGYVPTSRTVNGKALTSNISLTASDVSALPSNTTYVSSFNGSTGAITYTAPVTSVNGQTGAVTVTTTVTQTLTSGTAIGSVAGTTLYAPTAYDDTALAARVTALEQIPWVTYYTGSNAPSNSQGSNGDLYFQTSE